MPKSLQKSQWSLVTDGGDWEALYRDGQLIREGHTFTADNIFEALGIPLEYISPDHTSPRPHPKKLSDVIRFDSQAAERRRKEDERLSKIAVIEKEIEDRQKKLAALKK